MATITLEITPELEQQLQEETARQGLEQTATSSMPYPGLPNVGRKP